MFHHHNFSLYFKYNLFLTISVYLFFLLFNSDYSLYTFALTFMGTVSTAATLVLLLYILFYPLAYLKTPGLYLLGLLFLVVHLGLAADFFIYRIYHFHVNAMVLNIITSADAINSLPISLTTYASFLVTILLFAVIQLFMIRRIKLSDKEKIATLNHKLYKKFILPLGLIIIIEKTAFGFAEYSGKEEYVSKNAVIPFYQSATLSVAILASEFFGTRPPDRPKPLFTNAERLSYPLQPLAYHTDANKTSIFIFASDAVRNSVITPEIAPNISAFANESFRYNNHISGGNSTMFGIFSLMYGLNGSYWFKFLAEERGSLLFTALQELNYQIRITSSTSTKWPEFKQTCYSDIKTCINDKFGGTPAQQDRQSSNSFKEWLAHSDLSRPLFSFVFLDAVHGYSYPPEYRKYLPDNDGAINHLTINETVAKTVLLNQYKNAVAYNDALFGEMIEVLKKKGLYENSIVIYTSDHGEEFYEYGTYGHNSAFNHAQVQSPLIIKFPGQAPKVINSLTSHVDVVPTLLNHIGVSTPASAYSNGHDLLSADYQRNYAFVSNWNKSAVLTDEYTAIFPNQNDKMFQQDIRTTDNYQKTDGTNVMINSFLSDLLYENSKFFN